MSGMFPAAKPSKHLLGNDSSEEQSKAGIASSYVDKIEIILSRRKKEEADLMLATDNKNTPSRATGLTSVADAATAKRKFTEVSEQQAAQASEKV